MKKTDTAALDRWEDIDYYEECHNFDENDETPYKGLCTGWKECKDYQSRLPKKAFKNHANWDWDFQHLNLSAWTEEWQKQEDIYDVEDQIKLIRVKERQFAKEHLEKTMQKELEKIIKDYPTSKECYDS